MKPEELSIIAGVVLSLLFSYVPGVNTWFTALKSIYKRIIMLVLLVVVAAAVYGLSCAGILQDMVGWHMTCDRTGLINLIYTVILAIMANQSTYAITPPTKAVSDTKRLVAGKADSGIGRG